MSSAMAYCAWIAPYFSQRGTKLNEINVLDIEMFYAHEKNTRNISGNTVAHYHANIHKALVDAVRLKLIPHNPASDVERPKKDNFVASYYTADELMEMFPIFAGTKMELVPNLGTSPMGRNRGIFWPNRSARAATKFSVTSA